jgi:hypothetical protein
VLNEHFLYQGRKFVLDTPYVQLGHDDTTGWKDRNGVPETYPMFESHFVTLNADWQRFWFANLQLSQPTWTLSRLKNAWSGLIADKVCFTDRNAPENGRADFINDPNSEKSGIGHRTITTGGNVFKVKGTAVKAGLLYYEVETLDGTKPPPNIEDVNILDTPWLIHKATTRTNITLPDGRRRVDPFPQLGGADVPSLLISNTPNFIRADWCERVLLPVSPYVR